MKTQDYIKNTQRFSRYKISEIQVGDFVQLTYASRKTKRVGASMSCHFTVEKIDPKIT